MNCLGGVVSENNKPTPFLCLLMRMLALAPAHDIVVEFIRNEEYKYVRCLGAIYLRLVGLPEDVYKELEPLLADYRKIAVHKRDGWELSTVDQFIETLLTQTTCIEIALPHLASRQTLYSMGKIKNEVRVSVLREEFNALVDLDDDESDSKRAKLDDSSNDDDDDDED